MITEHIALANIKTSGCLKSIKSSLRKVQGIVFVDGNVQSHSISISFEAPKSHSEALNQLKTMGYPPLGFKNTIWRKMRSYVSCTIGTLTL